MNFILNHLYFEFSLIFLSYLIIIYLINLNIKSFFKKSEYLFYVHYIAVWIHELCHYVAALACLKLPKFNPIKIEHKEWKMRISGSIQVRVYTYKDLIYHIVNWEKVTATMFFIWELFSWFVIWLAPIIFPFLFIYIYLLPENISLINEAWKWDIGSFDFNMLWEYMKDIFISWKVLFIAPLFLFFAMVSSVSKEDIFNALPWIFVLTFIPSSSEIFTVLLINLSLMWVVLALCLFFNMLRNLSVFIK